MDLRASYIRYLMEVEVQVYHPIDVARMRNWGHWTEQAAKVRDS